MQIVIEIPDAPIEDYRDLFYKIHNMAASEGLFKEKSQRALALKAVLNILGGIVHGAPLPKGHGDLKDADVLCDYFWDNRSKLYTHKDLRIVIDNAPTIIASDKESEL